HFSLEEEYMIKLNFPGTEEHIRAHDKFRIELESMMQEFTSYDELFRKALSEFLSEWLKGHIFGIDKKLEAFILKSPYK
ncbi:MAG: hemerythrin family protein, partial [Thiotrichaceae bacterium]|nr:hemerythrin family protein [Thiotrichaceae bacterium]